MREVTVTDDLAVLAVVLGVAGLIWLLVHLARAVLRLRTPARPALPQEDLPPAGLGRLVPEGPQVLHEARRGAVALELWLAATHRRRSAHGATARLLPRQRAPRRSDSGAGAGTG